MKLRDVGELSKEDLLDMMGLETKGSAGWMAAGLGMLALGAALGAAAALLLAPGPGRDTRHFLAERLRSYRQRMGQGQPPVTH
jgi:hypothetical protein